MIRYLLKRLLYFIPTLLAISLLTFFISVNAPGDPVDVMLNRGSGETGQSQKSGNLDKQYQELRKQLGLDLPLFYFNFTDVTQSDTLYKIAKPAHRYAAERLSRLTGSWTKVYEWLRLIEQSSSVSTSDSLTNIRIQAASSLLYELPALYDTSQIRISAHKIDSIMTGSFEGPLSAGAKGLMSQPDPYAKYFPTIHFHGTDSQYHRWISGFLAGDFGISYQDKRPVAESFSDALSRTLTISLLAIFLSFGIAIPLGVFSAVEKGSKKENYITTGLFLLYSLPTFWIATMLVVFFCGGDYLDWFPAPGAPPIPDDAPVLYKIGEGLYRLILPLFCWTYGSLAFISRQMRGGILNNLPLDYVTTARAKGLDEQAVIWKHVFKNSLLPVVTLIAAIFPLTISGSFVIETIFNIPGMGKLSLDALYSRDYPVIFTVMMFTAILTMLGNLVSDLIYALLDPRISYTSKG